MKWWYALQLQFHGRRAADLNFLKAFWRAEPSCLGLSCNADCNPMSAHCGRAAEVFEQHNASLTRTVSL